MVIHTADLHVHTTASDGLATPDDVLRRAVERGLAVIAITDHDTIDGALEARRLAPRYGIEVIVGEEVSTLDGHLLVLFIEEALPAGRPAAETIAAAHARGGLCIAPHPYDWMVSSLGKTGLAHRCTGAGRGEWAVDAIEGINASAMWPFNIPNLLAQRLARRLGLPAVAGSDAHTLATVGHAYTAFPGRTADDLRRAIEDGTTTMVGQPWTLRETLDFYRLTLRERGLRDALALARSNVALGWWRASTDEAMPDPMEPAMAGGLR